jgi:hypothetical protein
MGKFTVEKILLSYEVPLVILAKRSNGDFYIGLNYEDGASSYRFYFSRIKIEHLKLLYEEKIDVHYALTKLHRGKYELAELWGVVGEAFQSKSSAELPEDSLPESGMFIPGHAVESQNSAVKIVDIDGQWEISDLRKFSDLVQDCYSMAFALFGAASNAAGNRINALFHKHPWRGGFSSVNFFRELYHNIPSEDRADIKSFNYSSPGEIKFYMNGAVASSIREVVNGINEPDSVAQDVYKRSYRRLQDLGWLSKSDTDIELSDLDLSELTSILNECCAALGIDNQADHILGLASGDPLSAVKIVFAYFRRLQGLADYVATGKAQNIFHNAY